MAVLQVRSLGSDHVVDYTRVDFTRTGRTYDPIIDNVGNRSVWALRRAMAPGGAVVFVGAPSGRWILGTMFRMLAAPLLSRVVARNLISHSPRRGRRIWRRCRN